jgi:hypothetical protein
MQRLENSRRKKRRPITEDITSRDHRGKEWWCTVIKCATVRRYWEWGNIAPVWYIREDQSVNWRLYLKCVIQWGWIREAYYRQTERLCV